MTMPVVAGGPQQAGLSKTIITHRRAGLSIMTIPLHDPLPGQFDYILQDIRNGLILPDHFENAEETDQDEEETTTYTRWWEDPNDPDYAAYQQQQKGRR
jgi:hypothetical protein